MKPPYLFFAIQHAQSAVSSTTGYKRRYTHKAIHNERMGGGGGGTPKFEAVVVDV